ncbi:MAG: arginine--tRNA ligase [Tissierellia bacterium]|nr:arginine--tRNA ligase [Tissierellia bacterium]
MDIKLEIAKILEKQDIGMETEEILKTLETPPNKDMGDYAFPCFRLAKTLRKAPNLIAEDLASKISSDFLAKVVNLGPYINFYVNYEMMAKNTIEAILEQKDDFGRKKIGQGQNVIIEYSSTNIAKPFHIGHIRSTVQGDALKRIFDFLGYNTIAINYLGDHGTQFGILLAAYELWGDKEAIDKNPINELLKLYVRYNDMVEEDADKMQAARDWFRRLEADDPEALKVWNWFKEISLKEFQRVYEMLDIEFDSYDGEHYHSKFVPEIIDLFKSKNLLEESDEAQIVDLGEDMPPAIILKRDASSTYITRDVATAIKRKEKYDFYKNIYVVATQQNLHFKQLKKLIDKLGYTWSDEIEHVAFGMVSLADGTLSTRKGQVVFLEDVLNKSVQKTLDIIEKRNPNLENKEKVASEIGIGAIKFQELFNNRIKDYVFDWDEVLNFDGETGPYVQYTHARANSLVNKYGKEISSDVDYSILSTDEEKDLIMNLYKAPEVIVQAMDKLEASLITRHLVEIAKSFNKFYNNTRIIDSSEEEQKARIALVKSSQIVIKNLLGLLGIKAPERM